jgi:asparagine synthetase B (glutamine-hydrolysing)
MCAELDGEFAFVLVEKDIASGIYTYTAARDVFGVRPLFIGQ